jgi:hypothetical protein
MVVMGRVHALTRQGAPYFKLEAPPTCREAVSTNQRMRNGRLTASRQVGEDWLRLLALNVK